MPGMARRFDFDCASPFFCMVTIKGHRATAPDSPEGFGPRWRPPREKERACAQGRMLFLALCEADARTPTRKQLYDRCHEMTDLACRKLQ